MVNEDMGLGKYAILYIIIATLSVTLPMLGHQFVEGASSSLYPSPLPIARPNCQDKCGNITIPFPFGIGAGCYYQPTFDEYGRLYVYNLSCDTNTSPPKLTYGAGIEVISITLEGEFRVRNYVSYVCYNPNASLNSWIYMKRFTLSTTENYIGAIGCDTYVWLNGTTMNNMRAFRSGCMTLCASTEDIGDNEYKCSGIGCCLVSVPNRVADIDIKIHSLNDQQFVQDFNPCSMAFIVAKDHAPNDAFPFSVKQMLSQNYSTYRTLKYPIVYEWSIGTENCKALRDPNLCKGNSTCIDWPDKAGYRCQCKPGFRGNPYLHDCQDIDECAEGNPDDLCPKPKVCVNTIGNYTCKCPQVFSRSSSTNINELCTSNKNRTDLPLKVKIIGGVGGGIIVSLIVAFWINWQHGSRKLKQSRQNNFRQNGGHILQQKLSACDVSLSNIVTMFTVEELEKATDNYSESSIIGRGGFGMVYKGTLTNKVTFPNNQLVAIKRSLKVDSRQVGQFINEIVALSQINNKNVVKLLGCCLETEVPLLVYEYISNGTLYEHLHDERKAHFLTWDVRLRIATEVSEVLAYLHNTISIPIIHRDIKTANILLDEKYTAKVADFGASKLAPVDQEQLGTMVQGTRGYLDPEYIQTGELTDKSDVYSFGVVLVELLTREKAISYDKLESERSLAICFLRKLKVNRLFDIVDGNIVNDGAVEQLKEVANLAKRCLKLKGEDRPTIKEVAKVLNGIREMGSHPWSNDGSGLMLEEESELLLGEKDVIYSCYGDEAITDPMSSKSRVVELVPLNDGR